MHLGGLVEGAGLLRRDDGHTGADGMAAPGKPGDHGNGLLPAVRLAQYLPIDIHHRIAADDGGGLLLRQCCPYRSRLPQGKLPHGGNGAGTGGDGFIAVAGTHRKPRRDDGEKLPAAGAGAGENDLFHGFGSL